MLYKVYNEISNNKYNKYMLYKVYNEN